MPIRNPLAGVGRKPAMRKGVALGAAALVTLALAGRTDRATTQSDGHVRNHVTSSSGDAKTGPANESSADMASPSPGGAMTEYAPGVPGKVRQGTMSLEVGKGTFDKKFAQIGTIAKRHNAEITSSSSERFKDDHSGSIEMRVPVADLGALTAELHGLGKVISASTDTYDIDSQVRQLEYQVSEYQRQADDLRARITKTTDAIQLESLRSQLANVQLQLDTANAQKAEAVDTEARATLYVDMQEDLSLATPTQLAQDWNRATAAALSVLGAVVIGLGYGLPTLLLFLMAWVAVRLLRRRPATAPVVA